MFSPKEFVTSGAVDLNRDLIHFPSNSRRIHMVINSPKMVANMVIAKMVAKNDAKLGSITNISPTYH
ncbi:hypothetical protein TNCV_487681 [Trichonephila clavipes]|nr:hypothetical protein TNCV_487681 [Trichonephila clavipes]